MRREIELLILPIERSDVEVMIEVVIHPLQLAPTKFELVEADCVLYTYPAQFLEAADKQ